MRTQFLPSLLTAMLDCVLPFAFILPSRKPLQLGQ